jgi:hypothetical protein
MGRRSFPWIFLLLILTACDSGEPGRLSVGDFENDEGEAVVRHLIAHMPVLEPDVPKEYCVVKGPRLMAASLPFMRRMNDLKLKFVSGEVLTVTEPNKSIVDPGSGLSPIQLQLLEMRHAGNGMEVVAGWAYKKTWERRRYRVTREGEGWKVEDLARIEGNYTPPTPEGK